jgi:ribosome biogenesis ATPase
VRKIIDDQGENDRIRLSVPAIYDTIKRSNSSLNRKPKRILEDSIERVVEVVKSDVLGEDEEDSVNGDFEGLEEQAQPVPVRGM